MGYLDDIMVSGLVKFQKPDHYAEHSNMLPISNNLLKGLDLVRNAWFDNVMPVIGTIKCNTITNHTLQSETLLHTKIFQCICLTDIIRQKKYIAASEIDLLIDSLHNAIICSDECSVIANQYRKKLEQVDDIRRKSLFANDIAMYLTGNNKDNRVNRTLTESVKGFARANQVVAAYCFDDFSTAMWLDSGANKFCEIDDDSYWLTITKDLKTRATSNKSDQSDDKRKKVTFANDREMLLKRSFDSSIHMHCESNTFSGDTSNKISKQSQLKIQTKVVISRNMTV